MVNINQKNEFAEGCIETSGKLLKKHAFHRNYFGSCEKKAS